MSSFFTSATRAAYPGQPVAPDPPDVAPLKWRRLNNGPYPPRAGSIFGSSPAPTLPSLTSYKPGTFLPDEPQNDGPSYPNARVSYVQIAGTDVPLHSNVAEQPLFMDMTLRAKMKDGGAYPNNLAALLTPPALNYRLAELTAGELKDKSAREIADLFPFVGIGFVDERYKIEQDTVRLVSVTAYGAVERVANIFGRVSSGHTLFMALRRRTPIASFVDANGRRHNGPHKDLKTTWQVMPFSAVGDNLNVSHTVGFDDAEKTVYGHSYNLGVCAIPSVSPGEDPIAAMTTANTEDEAYESITVVLT